MISMSVLLWCGWYWSSVYSSKVGNLSMAVIESLNVLYDSTRGYHWLWKNHTGEKWNFTKDSSGAYTNDPCACNWQGICCSSELISNTKNCSSLLQRVNISFTDAVSSEDSIIALFLPYYGLDGTLPENLFNITSLKYFSIVFNEKLVGSIPESISRLHYLTSLGLNNNNLDGSIPSLASLTKLVYLGLYSNHFHGGIPELNLTTPLAYYGLADNYFTGTIPSFTSFSTLTYFGLNNNLLEGSLPSLIGLAALACVVINNNYFTGTISSSYFSPALSLKYIYLSDNQLHGTLPSEIGVLTSLITLDVQDNYFSDKLPSSLKSLPAIQSLLVHGNNFVGHPTHVFAASLINVDISDNGFTGPVPKAILSFQNISHVSMIKNCFTGSIASDICDHTASIASSSLMSLAMDGLTSGTDCQTSLITVTNSYTVQHFLDGTIPECFFQLPRLKVLQFSGNGLGGALPSSPNFYISPSLRNLTLSHNRLTGVIPLAFQQHAFDLLDLSYNKLSGDIGDMGSFFNTFSPRNFSHVIQHNITTSTIAALGVIDVTRDIVYDYNATSHKELVLEVNRLSGLIPASFHWAHHITIVNGNLFDCVHGSGLPVNDPGALASQCGSVDLNGGLGSWLVLVVLFAVVLLTYRLSTRSREKCMQPINQLIVYYKATDLKSMLDLKIVLSNVFMQLMIRGLQLELGYCLWSLAFMLPFEIIIKFVYSHSYSTHLFQYAYTPSVAFVASPVPAAWYSAIIALVMLSVWYLVCFHCRAGGFSRKEMRKLDADLEDDLLATSLGSVTTTERVMESSLWIILVIMDASIMIVVNSCYLYVALYEAQYWTFWAQVGLVAFKLTWNSRILPLAVNYVEMHAKHSGKSSGMILTVLILFNNVLAPVIITICTQPACFYNIFVPADPITASVKYSTIESVAFSDGTTKYLSIPHVEQLSFEPPFIYSFQCSSSLITYYVPMFVIMYTYLAFFSPLVAWLVTHLHESSSSATVRTVINVIGYDIMQTRIFLMQQVEGPDDHETDDNKPLSILTTISTATLDTHKVKKATELIHGRDLMAVMICHFATLLTFGVAYPLLSLIIACAAVTETLQWRVLVGRYITFATHESCDRHQRKVMLERLDQSCAGVGDMLHQSRWLLLASMSLFFSLFLLDMAGDSAGDNWRGVVWAPLVVLLVPVPLKLGELLLQRHTYNKHMSLKKGKQAAGTSVRRELGLSLASSSSSSSSSAVESSSSSYPRCSDSSLLSSDFSAAEAVHSPVIQLQLHSNYNSNDHHNEDDDESVL